MFHKMNNGSDCGVGHWLSYQTHLHLSADIEHKWNLSVKNTFYIMDNLPQVKGFSKLHGHAILSKLQLICYIDRCSRYFVTADRVGGIQWVWAKCFC